MNKITLLLTITVIIPVIIKAQIISTYAGGDTLGLLGDGGPATAATIPDPGGGFFDKFGNYYCESGLGGNRIREVNNLDTISTVAGSITGGFCGDGGQATAACLYAPTGAKIDTFGNIYIADHENFRIRKVNGATGAITTIAGTGTYGYNGDGIPATNAEIWADDVCVDPSGNNVYIADFDGRRVRKVDSSGVIYTVAGTGAVGSTGDGGPATAAELNPTGIALDDTGNLYIADPVYNYVRKVNALGIITTVAGNGSWVYTGDGIPATNAPIQPWWVCIDHLGNIYIADKYNLMVYKVDTFGILHHVAGNGMTGYNGDGIQATAASLDFPSGVAVDACGNLYITEADNKRVRKVSFNPTCTLASLGVPETTTNDVIIYPNPATETVSINGLTTRKEYALLNITGIIEQQGELKAGDNTLNVQSLPPGLYVLEMTDEDGNRTVNKIIKQ